MKVDYETGFCIMWRFTRKRPPSLNTHTHTHTEWSEYCSLATDLVTQQNQKCFKRRREVMLDSVLLTVGLDVRMSRWGRPAMPWAIKDYHVCFCLRFNKNLKPCSQTLKTCHLLLFCDVRLASKQTWKGQAKDTAANVLFWLSCVNSGLCVTVGIISCSGFQVLVFCTCHP